MSEPQGTKIVEGRAMPLGTRRIGDRFKMDGTYNPGLGFMWSSIGLGTYLGEMNDSTDKAVEQAIRESYQAGVNVFDTALNYRGQRAERCLGRVLTEIAATTERRSELIVCSKGGFLPLDGELDLNIADYTKKTYLDPGIIQASDVYGQNQCYTPDFLEACINQSLKNLNVEMIDIYYLHNVEFVRPQMGDEKFDRMLMAAFERLEKMVSDRKIGYYGLATWIGIRADPKHQGHISLEKVIKMAESIAGRGHHLRFFMSPFSLLALEALELETQKVGDEWLTLIDAVKKMRVGLIGSSPLAGGLLANQWPGVPEDRCELIKGMDPMQQALQFARSVPGFVTTLSGMKNPDNLKNNLQLFSNSRPWETEELAQFMEAAAG